MPAYKTFLDVVKDTHNGEVVERNKEFIQETTFLNELPYKEANEKDRDIGIFYSKVENFETTKFTNLDNGVLPTKTGSYQRADIMGMLESALEFNRKTIEHMDAGERKLTIEDGARQRRIQLGLDTEFALLNFSPNRHPDSPLGLSPRYNTITNIYGEVLGTSGATGETFPYVTLDAEGGKGADSGADGSLSSLYLVYFNPVNGVSCLYPRGWTPGIKETYSDWYVEKNNKGEIMYKSNIIFQNKFGLKIGNTLSCTRIANINPKSDVSMEKMVDLLYDAFERMPAYMRANARMFTTSEVTSALRKKNRADRVSVNALEENNKYNFTGDVMLDGFRLTPCQSLLRTEGRIKLVGEV